MSVYPFESPGSERPLVDPDSAEKLGIFNAETLKRYGEATRSSFLIDNIIGERTVNLCVGNSGLGKTPLVVSMGIAVAAGVPWLGRPVRQGRVLICDGESSYPEFFEILTNVSGSQNLQGIPGNLYVWSPMWAPYRGDEDTYGPMHLDKIVSIVQPDLVILDPVRLFFPRAEGKSEETMSMFKFLRGWVRKYRCAWILVHHRRKIDQNYRINLETDPLEWFQQSCGSLALVNHTDTRVGIDLPKGARADKVDLLMAGFVRSHGRFGPLHLARVYDDDGVPLMYRQLAGLDYLPEAYQEVFRQLDTKFRSGQVKKALGGTSDSNAAAFLKIVQAHGLAKKLGRGLYEKILENLEKPEIPNENDRESSVVEQICVEAVEKPDVHAFPSAPDQHGEKTQ